LWIIEALPDIITRAVLTVSTGWSRDNESNFILLSLITGLGGYTSMRFFGCGISRRVLAGLMDSLVTDLSFKSALLTADTIEVTSVGRPFNLVRRFNEVVFLGGRENFDENPALVFAEKFDL